MTCKIISASHASINGSTTAYGGSIVSASYSPSTINGYNRASVTIAGATSTPAGNDGASVGIAGLSLNMRVGNVTESARVGSVSTTTIHYYDNSQILDNEFVFLKEEVPEGLGGIGDKFGPRPDLAMIKELGLIVPASDTVFVKLSDFYQGAGAGALIASAPGKTVYNGEQFMAAFGGILGDGFSVPNAAVDFQGTLREVIVQMCNAFGMIAYWDPETDGVVSAPIGGGGGGGGSGSSNGCTVIATSSTSDYTGSRAQGAIGSFSTSNDGESQSSTGGNMSRYFLAKLLTPKLKMKINGCENKKVELNIFDGQGNMDPNIGKMISAAQDSAVWSLYALQSVFGGKASLLNRPFKVTIPGKDNSTQNFEVDLSEMRSLTMPPGNSILRDYYTCQLENVHLLGAPRDGNLGALFKNAAKGWNDNPGSSPVSIVGEFTNGDFNIARLITGAFLFAEKGKVDSSIFSDNISLNGNGDVLRKFFQTIPKFINSMYVVKVGAGERSASTSGKNYGYYITANSAHGGQQPRAENGFRLIAADPWRPISECGDSLITDLASVLYAINGPDGCGNPLEQFTLIDFIHAVEYNKLEALFAGGLTQAQGQNTAEAISKGGQGHLMYIMVPTTSAAPADLGATVQTCFQGAVMKEISTPSSAVAATKKIGNVSLGSVNTQGGHSTLASHINGIFNVGVISMVDNLHDKMPITTLTSSAPRTIRLWFNVEGNSSSLKSGPGHASISSASFAPGGAWKSSMDFGVSVNGADIAYNNGIQQSYLATTYDEGFTYSRQNIGAMAKILNDKIAASTWIDDEVGSSTSTTYLLVDDNMPDIPSVAEGLDSLNISTAGGKTELTITKGNANIIRARATLRDLKAKNSHLQHSHSLVLPNVLNSAPNTKIQNIANGNP